MEDLVDDRAQAGAPDIQRELLSLSLSHSHRHTHLSHAQPISPSLPTYHREPVPLQAPHGFREDLVDDGAEAGAPDFQRELRRLLVLDLHSGARIYGSYTVCITQLFVYPSTQGS